MEADEISGYFKVHKYSSPIFIYSQKVIEGQIKKLVNAFDIYPRTKLLYAIKANNFSQLVSFILDKGFGAHVSSIGEYKKVQKKSTYISHTGPFIDDTLVNRLGLTFNLNTLEELKLFSLETKLGLRINPNVGWSLIAGSPGKDLQNHFGVPLEAFKDRSLPPNIYRLHMHNNSDCLKIDPFVKGLKRLLEIAKVNPHISVVNIGGGFGTPTLSKDHELDLQELARQLTKCLTDFYKATGRRLELQIEAGNFLVRPAGAYVFQVKNIAVRNGVTHYYTDGTSEHLYGIRFNRQIRPLQHKLSAKKGPALILGSTCRMDDILGRFKDMPNLKVKDLLYIDNAGAYCAVRANDFNNVGMPNQVMI